MMRNGTTALLAGNNSNGLIAGKGSSGGEQSGEGKFYRKEMPEEWGNGLNSNILSP